MFDHLPSSGKRRLTTFQGSTYMASQPISPAPKYPVSRVMVNSPYPITGLSNVTNPTQLLRYMCIEFWRAVYTVGVFLDLAVCQNLVPLVNIKIAGKWMFIPLKMVLIGIDPYPYVRTVPSILSTRRKLWNQRNQRNWSIKSHPKWRLWTARVWAEIYLFNNNSNE
jgi:hypothetical protein